MSIRLTNHAENARRWAEAAFDAFPALAAELRTLRARVAELEEDNQTWAKRHRDAMETATRKVQQAEDISAERDRLRAERDAARAEAAGLREALHEAIDVMESLEFADDQAEVSVANQIEELRTALARTPAQHQDRIVAAGLRETANRLHPHIDRETLLAEAERLEKEVGNG